MNHTVEPPKTSETRLSSVADTSNRGVSAYSQQQIEETKTGALEPKIGRTLGRLLHEFVYIVFFMGLHWVIKWMLTETHQGNEKWALYLLYVSKVYALTAFTIIFGAELAVDCVRAVKFALRQIRKK
jgi:hypothetical protein